MTRGAYTPVAPTRGASWGACLWRLPVAPTHGGLWRLPVAPARGASAWRPLCRLPVGPLCCAFCGASCGACPGAYPLRAVAPPVAPPVAPTGVAPTRGTCPSGLLVAPPVAPRVAPSRGHNHPRPATHQTSLRPPYLSPASVCTGGSASARPSTSRAALCGCSGASPWRRGAGSTCCWSYRSTRASRATRRAQRVASSRAALGRAQRAPRRRSPSRALCAARARARRCRSGRR